MKRDRLDFNAHVPELRELYFNSDLFGRDKWGGPRQRLAPALAHALEVAYMVGSLDTAGVAMGYPADDVRARCLALQRQAAERLGELKEARNGYGTHTPQDRANRTVKRRAKANSDYRYR